LGVEGGVVGRRGRNGGFFKHPQEKRRGVLRLALKEGTINSKGGVTREYAETEVWRGNL